MTHINQTAFGLSMGILWGAGLFLLAVTSMLWGYGSEVVDLAGTVYLGAGSGSWAAAFLTLVWGFVDGFVAGWLLAWIYNRLS